ncbi:MAG: hypothetical protein NC319_09850, partial [Butyricicoccus sp.]|nr:hypothetical protein [Butyricicoccus sp.]
MTNDDNALFIAEENLETYAGSVARAIKPDGTTTARAVCADIKRSLREISRVHDAAMLKWRSIAAMPGCVRWLLDNHYLVRREGLAA